MRWLDECWWGCSPCLLSSIGWTPADVRAWVRARDEWADRRDEANSTENSPAWSPWLPPNGVDITIREFIDPHIATLLIDDVYYLHWLTCDLRRWDET
jgi:hypothetical protein